VIKYYLVLVLVLIACTSTTIQFPSVCPNNEPKCQRNLNAQTLSLIGKDEAAVQLMCQDSGLKDVLGDQCTSQ